MAQRWWTTDVDERYWMESTDRLWEELGHDLWNWADGIGGRPIGPSELLDEMNVNDIIFHYYKREHAIVGYSTVVSNRASRGRLDDGPRDERPWIARGIGGFKEISPAVSLADIRAESSRVFAVMGAIKARSTAPHHLALIDNHGASPPNAYISKMPREVVEILGLLSSDPGGCPIGIPRKGPKPPPSRPAAADPFQTDPDEIDRGTQAHHVIQEALAAFVVARGAEMRDPDVVRREPPFDLAWWIGGELWIAEVKSTTAANERAQLRYGLGQLLRDAQDFPSIDPPPSRVLVVERPVTDSGWIETCRAVGVTLTWPAAFDEGLVTPRVAPS